MFNSREEKKDIVNSIVNAGEMEKEAAETAIDWRITQENNLVMTTSDNELNLASNVVIAELREDEWYCRDKDKKRVEKIRDYDLSVFDLFIDAERSRPTVHGQDFRDSDEYQQLSKELQNPNLSTTERNLLKNNALINFLSRIYSEYNHGQIPPTGLIENIINAWHQSLAGSFRMAIQLPLSFYQFSFPHGHTNNDMPFTTDLTMNSQGAYLETMLDAEAVRRTVHGEPYYALPGDTRIASFFELRDERGFQFQRVAFGSTLLKKLSLQYTVDQEDLQGLMLLKARKNDENAVRELRLIKYKRACNSNDELQNLLLDKYRQAYKELKNFLEDNDDPAAAAARNVMHAVAETTHVLGKDANLFLLKETLERVKKTVEDPSPNNLEQCRVLSQTLREPRYKMMTNALTDFVTVMTAAVTLISISMVLLPVLPLVSVPLVVGLHLAPAKPPASLLAKVSLFYAGLKRNLTSNALDQFAEKAAPNKK